MPQRYTIRSENGYLTVPKDLSKTEIICTDDVRDACLFVDQDVAAQRVIALGLNGQAGIRVEAVQIPLFPPVS